MSLLGHGFWVNEANKIYEKKYIYCLYAIGYFLNIYTTSL